MVRQTLQRRAKRRLCARALGAEVIALIDAVLTEFVSLGLLDDAKFADGRASSLTRKGLSHRVIEHGLRAKGLTRDLVELAAGGIDDLTQARQFIERKRLGSLRRGGATPESRKKDLAALARAGFSFSIASRALDTEEEA